MISALGGVGQVRGLLRVSLMTLALLQAGCGSTSPVSAPSSPTPTASPVAQATEAHDTWDMLKLYGHATIFNPGPTTDTQVTVRIKFLAADDSVLTSCEATIGPIAPSGTEFVTCDLATRGTIPVFYWPWPNASLIHYQGSIRAEIITVN